MLHNGPTPEQKMFRGRTEATLFPPGTVPLHVPVLSLILIQNAIVMETSITHFINIDSQILYHFKCGKISQENSLAFLLTKIHSQYQFEGRYCHFSALNRVINNSTYQMA